MFRLNFVYLYLNCLERDSPKVWEFIQKRFVYEFTTAN